MSKSYWYDALIPWKSIPNMAKDVKKAWNGEGKDRHDSFLGAIGKHADPFGALLGEDVQGFLHDTVPREANRALEPVGEFHRDNLDPMYKLFGDTEWGKAITDQGVNKGGDWSALITGAVLGGGALAGGGAGGSSGGGAAGMSPYGPYASGYQLPAGGGSGGAGATPAGGGMNWSDPNSWMQMARGMPSQQQPMQTQPSQESVLEELERRRREREARDQAIRLAQAIQESMQRNRV